MMQYIDDILVLAGLLLLGVGVYALSGWVAVVLYAGFMSLIAGVALAMRGQ